MDALRSEAVSILQAALRRKLIHHRKWVKYVSPEAKYLQAVVRSCLLHRNRLAMIMGSRSILAATRRLRAADRFWEFVRLQESEEEERRALEEEQRRLEQEKMREEQAHALTKDDLEQRRITDEKELALLEAERLEEQLRRNKTKLAGLEAARIAQEEGDREREKRRMRSIEFLQAVVRRSEANRTYASLLGEWWSVQTDASASRYALTPDDENEDDLENLMASPREVATRQVIAAARQASSAARQEAMVREGLAQAQPGSSGQQVFFDDDDDEWDDMMAPPQSLSYRLFDAERAKRQASSDLLRIKNRCAHLKRLEENSRRKAMKAQKEADDLANARARNAEKRRHQESLKNQGDDNLSTDRYCNVMNEWRRKFAIKQKQETLKRERQEAARQQKREYQENVALLKGDNNVVRRRTANIVSKIKSDEASLRHRQQQMSQAQLDKVSAHYVERAQVQEEELNNVVQTIEVLSMEEEDLLEKLRAARDVEVQAYQNLLNLAQESSSMARMGQTMPHPRRPLGTAGSAPLRSSRSAS
mmetsp:Transcript_16783/g.39563  ORF Transcript_16783/g.39563 Transcript_16783/m.39563 type:complete len:535 (+) Transcript_16783:52-1656(+)